jgi:CubicO group peptidase (beta-lactamase class C family)
MTTARTSAVRRLATPRACLSAAAIALAAGTTWGQEEPPAATPITIGAPHAARLGPQEKDAYTLELDASQFVSARADQVSVDVAVAVYDPEGKRLGAFDGPARGPEWFQFESSAAGAYRIEISPFEDGAGEYTLEIVQAEPIATEPGARVDQIMAPYNRPGVPGGVVAVVQGGETIFAGAYGTANLTHDVPFAIDTRTNIGSTSKQFTAFGIALLAQRGELSLDDDVRTHIPELPDLGETVTLRHLLTHTSGYREFLNTLLLTGRRLDRGDSIDRAELIEIVQRQPELQNSPGAEWNYNNTGYGLLTVVIERVTGEPFPQWMRANVFEPLGMHDTRCREHPAKLIERSAQGYAPEDDGGYLNATDLGGALGAGGIYTTVADLAAWVRNFRTGDLGGPEMFELMATPYELTSGESSGYGLGLSIDEHRGLRRVHHGGADSAHRSMLMYFPELDAAVITLSNNATFTGAIANAVAEAFFAGDMAPEPKDAGAAQADAGSFDAAQFDPESFDAFAGRYELEAMPGFIMSFMREGDRYFTQATRQPKVEIFPTSPNTFKLTIVEASITFHPGPDGKAETLTLHQNGDHTATRVAEEAWSPTPEMLEAYTGRYFSEELETFYHLEIEDGKLVIKHRRLDDIVLAPTGEHAFTGGMPVAIATFEADAAGKIVAFTVSNGRTRGVRFERFE